MLKKICYYLFFLVLSVQLGKSATAVFIYASGSDSVKAISYKTLLDANGMPTTLVRMSDVLTTNIASYSVVIIGNGTGNGGAWGDSATVAKLRTTNRAIVGLGEGGYAFLGKLGLTIGYPYGSHGPLDSVHVPSPLSSWFTEPLAVSFASDSLLLLYKSPSNAVWISVSHFGASAVALANDNSKGYALLATEHGTYGIWCFSDPPDSMTTSGKYLFVNFITQMARNLIAHYPLLATANDTTANFSPMTLTNTPFSKGGIYSSGAYIGSSDPNKSNAETPQLANFNFASFALFGEFLIEDSVSGGQPIFIGGEGYRWAGATLAAGNTLGMKSQGGNMYHPAPGYVTGGTWHSAMVTYDSIGAKWKLYFENHLVATDTGAIQHGTTGDRSILTNDLGTGRAFKGYLRNLKIYNNSFVPRPVIALPVSPMYGTKGLGLPLLLQWRKVPNVSSYLVQIATDSLFSNVVKNIDLISDTLLNVSGIAPNSTYFWRIHSTITVGGGYPYWSSAWKLSIAATPPPVTLVAPANGITVIADSVTVRWNSPATGILAYWLERATDSTFTSPIIDSTLTDTSKVIKGISSGTTWWWDVRAKNLAGWGPMSPKRHFTVTYTGVEAAPLLPTTFALGQNYPNPFNPVTTIQYDVPRRSHVAIDVFNTLGQRVVTLVDGEVAPGTYRLSFGGPEISSGIYFYRMRAEGYVSVRKAVVLK